MTPNILQEAEKRAIRYLAECGVKEGDPKFSKYKADLIARYAVEEALNPSRGREND